MDIGHRLADLNTNISDLETIILENPNCLDLLSVSSLSTYDASEMINDAVKHRALNLGKGRPSYLHKYPDIPQIVSDFLERHAIGAHDRRHDESMKARNVTVDSLAEHVNSVLQYRYADKSINLSWSTVRRVGLPLNKSRAASKYYSGAVPFRQAARKNDLVEDPHKASHYTLAQIKSIREAAVYYEEEVMILSCDNKNKIPLANTAVHHMNRPHGMHLADMCPNAPDHSYPQHPDNAKITPSGYMQLQQTTYPVDNTAKKSQMQYIYKNANRRRCRSEYTSANDRPRTKTVKRRCHSGNSDLEYEYLDKYGRPHFEYPCSGQLHLCLFPTCFYDAVSCRHVNNMYNFLWRAIKYGRRKVVFVLVDGGPDWSFKSPANMIMYGRLWLRSGLDALILACYAPKHSKYNPMERRWGPGTKILTSARLSHKVPGDDRSPWDQAELTEDERERKIDIVVDNACQRLIYLWDQEKFNGFKTTSYNIKRNDGRDIFFEDDYNRLKQYLKTLSLNSRSTNPGYLAEANFIWRHMVRTRFKIEFKKCNSSNCGYCASNGIESKQFFAFLKKSGDSFPTPQKSIISGHYLTFFDLLNSHTSFDWRDAPEFNSFGSCRDLTCNYEFYSKADEKKHNLLAHGISNQHQ